MGVDKIKLRNQWDYYNKVIKEKVEVQERLTKIEEDIRKIKELLGEKE